MVAGLDLFYLLVENVFGSILLSGIGIAAGIWLIGMYTKMSTQTLMVLEGTFLMAFSIGYVGGLAALLWGIAGLVYFFWSVLNLMNAPKS